MKTIINTWYNSKHKRADLMSKESNEKIIRDLRKLVVSPNYTESISVVNKIDKKSLLREAKKVAKNLDNAAAATAISL